MCVSALCEDLCDSVEGCVQFFLLHAAGSSCAVVTSLRSTLQLHLCRDTAAQASSRRGIATPCASG